MFLRVYSWFEKTFGILIISFIALIFWTLHLSARPDFAAIVPGDPLVYVEVKNVSRLIERYDQSGLKARLDSSSVMASFLDSRLGLRLSSKWSEIEAATGVHPLRLMKELAAGRAALAVNDIGKFELIIIAERSSATGPLLSAFLSKSSRRDTGGAEVYIREDARGNPSAVVAMREDVVIFATVPALAEETLARIADITGFQTPVAERRLLALGKEKISADMEIVLDLARLRKSVHFRKYWLTGGTGFASQGAVAAVSTLLLEENGMTEMRYFSASPESDNPGSLVANGIDDGKFDAWDATTQSLAPAVRIAGEFLFDGNDSVVHRFREDAVFTAVDSATPAALLRVSRVTFENGLPVLERAVLLEAPSIATPLARRERSSVREALAQSGAIHIISDTVLVAADGSRWAFEESDGCLVIGTPPELVSELMSAEVRAVVEDGGENLLRVRQLDLSRISRDYGRLFRFLSGVSEPRSFWGPRINRDSRKESAEEEAVDYDETYAEEEGFGNGEDEAPSTSRSAESLPPPGGPMPSDWFDRDRAGFLKKNLAGFVSILPFEKSFTETRRSPDGRVVETTQYR